MATFKTRARTLDMLGRQQIAGIPTAISELFKNAHDAYADKVEIDYYRSDGLFVLRDDGIGMTKTEFIERWLTIGTDNKLDRREWSRLHRVAGRPRRPILGEKGIGRLAIATIGPQVLVLTRAKRGDTLSDLTAAFINWSIFECPGIDLDDIRVPIRSFRGGELPDGEDVAEMVADFRHGIGRLQARIGREYYERIDLELDRFKVDPQAIDGYLRAPTLRASGAGTHFILLPASDLLADDIDGEPNPNDDKAPPLMKALLGFANTMSIEKREPVIRTAFRDHKSDVPCDDLITDREFFTREEFRNADHQVTGRFDEHGQFVGRVAIYGDTIENHVIPWRNPDGRPTACGPFVISFAAIEGETRHSTLPHEEHASIVNKTNRLGGLYIYRDGIRILPYGDTDYDWLEIEFRRTKSAYYYYFSHRKMFGVVEINSERNKGLHEKAGREGFQENKAYRQFRSILRNFFVQMAADFFRKEGSHSDRFETRKADLEKTELDRRRREKLVSEKRRRMKDDLGTFFERVDRDEPQDRALRLSQNVEDQLRNALRMEDRQRAAQEIMRIERSAAAALRDLESRYRVARPKIALTKALQRDWRAYTAASAELETNVFRGTRETIEDLIRDEAAKARLELDHRLRTETALNELAEHARKATRDRGAEARRKADSVADDVREAAAACIREVESALRSVIADFQRTELSSLGNDEFRRMRAGLESTIREVWEKRSERLESIRSQLEAIDLSGETSTLEDQLVAVEQRNVLLEEKAAVDLQLAQLGMAVEIINHEFRATVGSLRNNLRGLKAWADVNRELEGLYRNIRASFDHLDGYLTLFTPLHRRLYRKEVEILGSEIYAFLKDLFNERLARHNVRMSRTDAFSEFVTTGYPSSFYPVFVNLVDNAIFWLAQRNPSMERTIELDVAQGAFRIRDSGPGVPRRDREAIFEDGFTRKPGGRGMGLSISRETLRRVGYNLTLAEPAADGGATFLISPRDPEEEGSNGAE